MSRQAEEFYENDTDHAEDKPEHSPDADDQDDESEDEIIAIRTQNKAKLGGEIKGTSINSLIRYFGRLVNWKPAADAEPDNKGKYREEDKIYNKLTKASTSILKVLSILKENEDFDERKLTLFICRQKWVNTQLRPLMELCSTEDSVTALRCCKLAIFLTRGLTKPVLDALNAGKKIKKSLTDSDEPSEHEESMTQEQLDENKKDKKKLSSEEIMKQQLLLQNAKEQLSAFLSFKEALCTENCNKSIIHAFQLAWAKESLIPIEQRNKLIDKKDATEAKTEIATCIAYFRRLLAIEASHEYSSPTELLVCKKVHNSFIIHLRPLIPVVIAICTSIQNAYHNIWLTDIILMISCILRDFDAKDLFRVWREHGLIPYEELLEDIADDENNTYSMARESKSLPEIHVPKAVIPRTNETLSAVALPKKLAVSLKQQRDLRQNTTMDSRNSRFKGVYVKFPTSTPNNHSRGSIAPATTGASVPTASVNSSDKEVEKTLAEQANSTSSESVPKPAVKLVRNLLQSNSRPVDSHVKRNKKHLTFVLENPVATEVQAKNLTTEEGQKALIVVATMIDMLTRYDEEDPNSIPGIRQLIMRVNEDRRRDDLIVGNEVELSFFQLVSKALMYNRLKVSELKRRHEEKKSYRQMHPHLYEDNPDEVDVWEPQIKNIINALDRMSLNRVVSSIERNRESKNYKDLIIPVELYKEQIANFRMLLESENEAHNDIALAGIYRIFYSSSERLDQLPKLLSMFKPGVHEKKYLYVLIELVHETMKTLEAASTRYNTIIDADSKQRLSQYGKIKKQKGKEVDYELYVSACLGFDVNEYFKRLVTNQSILLYSMLLKEYNSLDQTRVHYIYCFLQRSCSFPIEQRYPAPQPPSRSSENTSIAPEEINVSRNENNSVGLTLMYMLFNIRTLKVFNDILQDPLVESVSYMGPLLRLIKSVVRKLGSALEKNHLLYVEMLFNHPSPHNFLEQIDNVYEAMTFRNSIQRNDEPLKKVSSKGPKKNVEMMSENVDRDTDNEADDTPDKPERNQRNEENGNSDHEEEFDDNVVFANDSSDKILRNGRRARELSDVPKKRNPKWTKEEDSIIRNQYILYSGTRSVFTMIVESDELRKIGNNRTEKDVQRRVKYLNLNADVGDIDGNDSDSTIGVKPKSNKPNQNNILNSSPNETDSSLSSPNDNKTSGGPNESTFNNSKMNDLEKIFEAHNASDDDGIDDDFRLESVIKRKVHTLAKENVSKNLLKKQRLSSESAHTTKEDSDGEDDLFNEELPTKKSSRTLVDSDDEM